MPRQEPRREVVAAARPVADDEVDLAALVKGLDRLLDPRRAGRVCDQELADRLLEAGDGFTLILEEQPAGRMDALPTPLAGALAVIRDAAAAGLIAGTVPTKGIL